MRRTASRTWLIGISVLWLLTVVLAVTRPMYGKQIQNGKRATTEDIHANAIDKIAETSCSAAKRNVTTATSSHSGPIPAGICIRPQKSVSTLFKRTAHRICDIARRHLVRCSHVSRAVFIMTVAFRHWTGWSITTTPA